MLRERLEREGLLAPLREQEQDSAETDTGGRASLSPVLTGHVSSLLPLLTGHVSYRSASWSNGANSPHYTPDVRARPAPAAAFLRPGSPHGRHRSLHAPAERGMHDAAPETCPVSTEGGTRRVHLVREGGGRGGGGGASSLWAAARPAVPPRRGRAGGRLDCALARCGGVPPPPPRTKWDTPRPSPRTNRTRCGGAGGGRPGAADALCAAHDEAAA